MVSTDAMVLLNKLLADAALTALGRTVVKGDNRFDSCVCCECNFYIIKQMESR